MKTRHIRARCKMEGSGVWGKLVDREVDCRRCDSNQLARVRSYGNYTYPTVGIDSHPSPSTMCK